METRSRPVFICGEDPSCDGDPILSIKSVLLTSLASNWPVRTHHEANGDNPRGDRETLFCNIASSHVFLFMFSEETTMNAFYLNQLGIAFAYGVPVVGIREPTYMMPNPLPEHYYATEVVNLSEGRPNDGRSRPNTRNKAILAHLLIETFRSAVVYTVDFHKSCLERLFRKVTDAYVRSEKERCVFSPGVTVTEHGRAVGKSGESARAQQKVWTCAGGLTKCPNCGSQVKAHRKTSVLRKTNSVDNLLKVATLRSVSQSQARSRDAPQLMITKSVLQPVVLQPVVLQPSFSKTVFLPGSRRPATSVDRQTSSATVGAESRLARIESRPTSSKSCNAIPDNSAPLKETRSVEMKRKGEGVMKETRNTKENDEKTVRRKISATGFITNKRGAFLRKMSSLPCIPTTYLVTEPGNDAPALVKYPPVNGSLSDDDANVPEFTDDEDKETIHISRRPSPAISTCSTNIE